MLSREKRLEMKMIEFSIRDVQLVREVRRELEADQNTAGNIPDATDAICVTLRQCLRMIEIRL